MIPIGLGAWLVVLLFPAIVTSAAGFPAYAVARYVVLRRHGEGPQAEAGTLGPCRGRYPALAGYLGLAVVILSPSTLPVLTSFLSSGKLAFIGPVILVDVLLGAILSPQRALAARHGGVHRQLGD